MFDISDGADMQEENKFVLSGITRCPALNDYKAIFVQPAKNMIGFFLNDRYLVYSYEESKGFSNALRYDFYEDDLAGVSNEKTMRGIYIGDYLYLAGDSYVVSFDIGNNLEKQSVLKM